MKLIGVLELRIVSTPIEDPNLSDRDMFVSDQCVPNGKNPILSPPQDEHRTANLAEPAHDGFYGFPAQTADVSQSPYGL